MASRCPNCHSSTTEALAAERSNPQVTLFKCLLCRCMWSERRAGLDGDGVGRGPQGPGPLASPDGVSPYRRT